tara:strand:- start:125 stop:334 length:210 start_codon:yes stop_codon:yes gene_type:complete
MKTAMQELMRFVDSFQEEAIHPRILRVKIKELLEKEKEQIIEAVEFGLFNADTTIDGQEYYNQKYNQNK